MKVLFLDCRPQQRSEREKNLETAYIRSHVGRHVQSKRKQQLSKSTRPRQASDVAALVSQRGQVISRRFDDVDQEKTRDSVEYELLKRLEQSWTLLSSLWDDLDRLAPVFSQVTEKSTALISNALGVRKVINADFFALMSDEAMFHTGSALIKNERQNLVDPTVRDREATVHRGKALQIIYSRLSKSPTVDNATLLAILVLPMSTNGDISLEKVMNHWTQLSSLVAARRNLGDIRDTPYGVLVSNNLDTAAPYAKLALGIDIPHSDGRTQDDIIADTRPVLADEIALLRTCDDLPEGFRTLARQGLIGITTLKLLKNYFKLVQEGLMEGESESSVGDFQHSYFRFHARPSSTYGEPGIEEVLYDVLMLLTARLFGPLCTAGFMSRSFRQYCTHLICRFAKPRGLAEEQALYWAWTVLVSSWKSPFGNITLGGINLHQAQIERFPCWVTDAQASTDVLKLFIYDKELLDDHDRFMQHLRACK